MKVYLKKDVSQIGLVTRIYTTIEGQKRMEVRFPHGTVDADVSKFELSNEAI
jgi:hypothetical protein